jgi:hypothetical protein
MKIVISESQYNRLIETKEEQKILHIPSLKVFNDDWFLLQKFLENKGNPPYSIGGDLDLRNTPVESLGNLISVGGNLYLIDTPIESLGNLISVGGNLYLRNTPIESLGNLQSVGGSLDLEGTPIKSLGNLTSVGGDLFLRDTPISKIYSKQEVSQLVNVNRKIYLKAPGKS